MNDRIKELEAELRGKEQQLQEALETIELLRQREAEHADAAGGLIAKIVHDINNLNTRIRSSGQIIAHAFSDLREHLPLLLFHTPPEQQKLFLAFLDYCEQQELCHERLSTREERRLKRTLKKELDTYEIGHADDIADTLVDMGVYEISKDFIPFLQNSHSEDLLEAASSLLNFQKINCRTLTPACDRIIQTTQILRDSIIALLANHRIKGRIADGLEKALAAHLVRIEQQHVRLHKQYDEDLPMLSFYPSLDLIWLNLIENAIEAVGKDAELGIALSVKDSGLLVQIRDNGEGIPEDDLEKIFERSFTSKSQGSVHGVGLYLVRQIIDRHQGAIQVESRPGDTRFSVWLPILSD